MRSLGYRRELKSAGMSQGNSAGRSRAGHRDLHMRYSQISQSYGDKKTITERHFLSISFQGIRERDPFGLQHKYRKKIKENDSMAHSAQALENEKYLVRFYTCCAMIPIFLVLGGLFYTFWWNEAHMADQMSLLEFQYNIVPAGPKASTQDLNFMDKPMAYEKDEIKLRDKFFYKQAYHIKTQALVNQNISDVTWEEQNVLKIIGQASNLTKTDRENIYQSQMYCLNVNYRIKNPSNTTKYMELHSSDDPSDDIIDVPVHGQTPFKKMADSSINANKTSNNQSHKADEMVMGKDGEMCSLHDKNCKPVIKLEQTKQQCLIPFHIWQEEEIDLFDSSYETVKIIKTKIEEEIFNNNAKKECESDEFGIYVDEWCYYYQVLKKLCLKVKIMESEKNAGSIDKVYYDSGCFEDNEATLFKNTVVGQYYDFSHEVSVEVRSKIDPYMVFSYSKYNLGTDFTLFFWMSITCFVMMTYNFLVICYMFCCNMQRIPKTAVIETSHEASQRKNKGQYDFDTEIQQFDLKKNQSPRLRPDQNHLM